MNSSCVLLLSVLVLWFAPDLSTARIDTTTTAVDTTARIDTTKMAVDTTAVKPEPAVPIYQVIGDVTARHADSLFPDVVVTRRQFEDWYHADFADLVSNLEGMYVLDLGSFGRTITASSDGGKPQGLLVLLDGRPFDEPDVGWVDLNSIPLEAVERIEYYRGGGTAAHGNGAISGYLNIVTKRVETAAPYTRVVYRSVFSDFRDIGAVFMRPLGAFGLTVGGSSKKTPGEQRAFGSFGTPFLQSRYNGKYLFGGIDFSPFEPLLIQYDGVYNKNRFDAYGRKLPNGTYETAGGQRKDTRWDHRFLASWLGKNQSLDISLVTVSLEKNFNAFGSKRVPESYTTRRAGLDVRYHRVVPRFGQATVGIARKEDRIERLETGLTYHKTEDAFLLLKRSGESFHAFGGVRYSHSSEYGDGVAADFRIVKPVARWLKLEMAGGYGYLYPSFVDRIPLADSLTNELATERGASGRFGLRLFDWLNLDEVGFWVLGSARTNVIGYSSPDTSLTGGDKVVLAGNSGDAQTVSTGVSLVKRFGLLGFRNDWTVRYQYRVTDRETAFGIPEHFAYSRFGFGRKFISDNIDVRANFTMRYFHDHNGFTFVDAPQYYYRSGGKESGGFLLSYRLSAEIGTIQFFIEQENILKQKFEIVEGYRTTDITFRLGLIWRFEN